MTAATLAVADSDVWATLGINIEALVYTVVLPFFVVVVGPASGLALYYLPSMRAELAAMSGRKLLRCNLGCAVCIAMALYLRFGSPVSLGWAIPFIIIGAAATTAVAISAAWYALSRRRRPRLTPAG